jgi:hypothetical protein
MTAKRIGNGAAHTAGRLFNRCIGIGMETFSDNRVPIWQHCYQAALFVFAAAICVDIGQVSGNARHGAAKMTRGCEKATLHMLTKSIAQRESMCANINNHDDSLQKGLLRWKISFEIKTPSALHR